MPGDLNVLRTLEPQLGEIMPLVQRDLGETLRHMDNPLLGENYVRIDYLARVDREDYVVSVADNRMRPSRIEYALSRADDSDIYLVESQAAQAHLKRVARGQRFYARQRPLFAGHVTVTTRDGFDVHESYDEAYSYGMMGYTLRRGNEAILHTTGGMVEDPEFFMRAVRAAQRHDPINPRSHFTAQETRQHKDIYGGLFERMAYLIKHDGLEPDEAVNKYADQYETTGQPSAAFVGALHVEAFTAPLQDIASRIATYQLGDDEQLLVMQRSNGQRSSFTALHERMVDGAVTLQRYEQPWDRPDLLLADAPHRKITDRMRHEHRLFLADQGHVLDLNAALVAATKQ